MCVGRKRCCVCRRDMYETMPFSSSTSRMVATLYAMMTGKKKKKEGWGIRKSQRSCPMLRCFLVMEGNYYEEFCFFFLLLSLPGPPRPLATPSLLAAAAAAAEPPPLLFVPRAQALAAEREVVVLDDYGLHPGVGRGVELPG